MKAVLYILSCYCAREKEDKNVGIFKYIYTISKKYIKLTAKVGRLGLLHLLLRRFKKMLLSDSRILFSYVVWQAEWELVKRKMLAMYSTDDLLAVQSSA